MPRPAFAPASRRSSGALAILAAILIVLASSSCSDSGTAPEQVLLPCASVMWNGHDAAFTFSSDDNNIENMEWAEVFRARGLRFTVFTVPRWVGRSEKLGWAELNRLAREDFEIGGHGLAHLDLTKLSEPELRRELKGSRDTLNLMITDRHYRCRVMAYPYNSHDERVMAMAAQYYEAVRDGGLGGNLITTQRGGVALWDSVSLYQVPQTHTITHFVDRNRNDEATTRASVREFVPIWKERRLWVNVSVHNREDCDAEHLAWVLDEILADGGV